MSIKMALTQSDVLDDWYLIERAEHDGRRWDERTEWGSRLLKSSRIVDDLATDVEGTARQMLSIATAIERRGAEEFRRCAVDATRDPVRFWSPRNSDCHYGETTLAEADALAKQIRDRLSAAAVTP